MQKPKRVCRDVVIHARGRPCQRAFGMYPTQNWYEARTEADLPTGAVVKVKKCRKRKKKNAGLLFNEAGGRSAGTAARHDQTVTKVVGGHTAKGSRRPRRKGSRRPRRGRNRWPRREGSRRREHAAWESANTPQGSRRTRRKGGRRPRHRGRQPRGKSKQNKSCWRRSQKLRALEWGKSKTRQSHDLLCSPILHRISSACSECA
jgi:hypothetical protein